MKPNRTVAGRHLLLCAWLPLLLLLPAGCQRRSAGTWKLTDIRGSLPDLRFDLATATNPHFTERDLRGKVVLLFFGYTHCPDVCPLTMAQLATALHGLGDEAANVRLLFISIDPKRDTPDLVASYAQAFSPQAVGARGTPGEIEALAKRYRVAYEAEAPDASGNYIVMHSKVVYIFDQQGHVRLLIDDPKATAAIDHDLRQLIHSPA